MTIDGSGYPDNSTFLEKLSPERRAAIEAMIKANSWEEARKRHSAIAEKVAENYLLMIAQQWKIINAREPHLRFPTPEETKVLKTLEKLYNDTKGLAKPSHHPVGRKKQAHQQILRRWNEYIDQFRNPPADDEDYF